MSVHSAYPKSGSRPTKPVPKLKPIPPKKRVSKLRLGLLGLGLTGLAMISATAGALLAVSLSFSPLRHSPLTTEESPVFSWQNAIAAKNLHLPQLSQPVNILVLGIKVLTTDLDQRPQEDVGYHALVNSFQGLADTMLLVRFDPVQQKMTVLSIPRDTQVEIPEKGLRKINEANQIGGAPLTTQVVSDLLGGVPVDRYLRVNVQGVEKFIDALGGVTVFVPKDLKYTDFSQHLYIDLKKGEQHLDGAKALQFLRYRYDGFGDIGRVQRQQQFMRALVEQALKPQTLLKLPAIFQILQSHIDTNLSLEELAALAGFASQTQRSDVQMLMLPGGFNGDGKHGTSYWLPHSDQISAMARRYFDAGAGAVENDESGYGEADSQEADPRKARIALQDSQGDPEATRQMVRYLEKAGYRHIVISERWQQHLTTTRIIAQNGDDSGAAALRVALGVGEVLVENTGNLASDVTIQVGADWQAKLPQLDF